MLSRALGIVVVALWVPLVVVAPRAVAGGNSQCPPGTNPVSVGSGVICTTPKSTSSRTTSPIDCRVMPARSASSALRAPSSPRAAVCSSEARSWNTIARWERRYPHTSLPSAFTTGMPIICVRT